MRRTHLNRVVKPQKILLYYLNNFKFLHRFKEKKEINNHEA